MTTWALALHGGAGVKRGRDYTKAEACMTRILMDGCDRLKTGGSALDVVEAAVAGMESSGLFVAGRGSAPNTLGQVELDASIVDGQTGRSGSVATLQGFESAIKAARAVMDGSPHVLLAGEGASRFARIRGLRPVGDLTLWLTNPDGFQPEDLESGHGTVGAAALDMEGQLAAATSTGGTYGTLPGRVGDTAVIGAGTWADDVVAVSCTGEGEAFIRAAAAHDVAALVQYEGRSIIDAADAVLAKVRRHGGNGGLIAVTRDGEIAMVFDTDGMKRACASDRMAPMVGSVGATLQPIG